MWIEFLAIFGFGLLLTVIVALASKNGSKAAQLEALKAEIRKQAYEKEKLRKISKDVSNFDEYTIRQRLHEVSNKQR
jgi:cell division protein FtsB